MTAKIHAIRGLDNRSEWVDVSSLQTKIEIYQRINREWAHELDPYETRVLLAIVDRTIGWGVREARFSAGRLLEGDAVCGPLNISRRALYRALASLEEKRFIRRRHPANDPDKTFYSTLHDREPGMGLNLPKRLKVATGCKADPVPVGHTPMSDRHTPVPEGHSIYSNPLTDNHSTDNRGAALADREPSKPEEIIRGIVKTAVASHATARTTKRETQATRNTAAGVEAAWRDALREAFPDAVEPVWTSREKGQAKRLASGWAHAKQITFPDFTDWAVRNWTQIMRTQFKWMTKAPPPAVPAFSLFASLIAQFAECWSEGKLEEWTSAKERTEVERMVARGMTYEQATSEFAKQNVASELRDEMRDREIKVRARSRAADHKLEQAKQLIELRGQAPIHPKSIAAQEIRARARPQTVPLASTSEETFAPLTAPMVDPNRNPFD